MSIKILLVSILIICVSLICGVYTFRIINNQKESFDSSCAGCNPDVWESDFKTVSSGSELKCNTEGCSSDIKATVKNNWDSNKLDAMKFYFDNFTKILKEADFEISKEDTYESKIISYKDDLKESYTMITKINSSGWGNGTSNYKTEYNNRWLGVQNEWNILGDLSEAYKLINMYFQSDVTVINSLDYDKEINPELTLFSKYYLEPTKYSDLNSDIGGNNHSVLENSFWKAITYTYFCLKYLSNLIILYKKKDGTTFSLDVLRNELIDFKNYFDGTKIADFNIDNIDTDINHIYKYFKQQVEQYAGDNYLEDAMVNDSNILDSSQIPKEVRVNAYNNYFYETLSNCNNLYNDKVDNWNESIELQKSMSEAKQSLTSSMITNNIDTQSDAVEKTKNIFWDNTNQDWKPNQEISNYSSCNPIINGEIENNTDNVSFFNFRENSDKAELQRKKIQYARKELISSLFGEDVSSYTISEKLPNCPSVLNQENTNIQGWTRSQNSDQETECLSSDSFKNEPTSYKIGYRTETPTQMKPGYIVAGIDNWIDNYENIKTKSKELQDITENQFDYNKTKDSKHTDLIRKAGSMQEVILKDRDWNGSTYKWNIKSEKRESRNLEYIVEKYLSVYKLKLSSVSNSSKYNFDIYLKFTDQEFRDSSSIIFINENYTNTVQTIKLVPSDLESGVVRLYKNMYQYSDYLTQTNNYVELPNINNLMNFSFLSIIYSKLEWDLDDMIEYGYDLNIICANNTNANDLYSSYNSFLYYESNSQFDKLYYSTKNQNNTNINNFSWGIFKDTNSPNFMLYNKSNEVFLALGSNYQLGDKFGLDTGIEGSSTSSGNNSNSNKKSFYFIKSSTLETLKESSVLSEQYQYNNMIQDCRWIIEEHKNNKYSIKSVNGDILWFTSSSLDISIINKSTSGTQNLGYITFTNVNDENSIDEESNYYFCDKNGQDNCYNKYFYIVPAPPEDISSDLKTWSFSKNNSNSIFKYCSNQRNGNTLNHKNWFKKHDSENRYSYVDIKDPSKNEYSDIYSLYGENGSYETGVLSLDGGDGENCATSNFCQLSKELLSNEKRDQQVNSIKQDSKVSNKQTQSRDINISFINKDKKRETATFKAPLNKYNFKCSRNDINIYKIYGNETKITYDSKMNPNLLTVEDDTNDDLITDRKIIVSIYSTERSYKKGIDFGVSSLGTFCWFKNNLDNSNNTYLDERRLRIVYGAYTDVLSKYIILNNNDISASLKKQRKKIITWDDKIKFMNIGFKFNETKTYAYPNIPSQVSF